MSSVSFHNADIQVRIEKKRLLKAFIPTIFFDENKLEFRVSIVVCSDNFLLSLNEKFLQHDFYTDILTFNLSTDKDLIAEIYISVDRIKENSRVNSVTFQTEFNRIIFHGILHLCEYKDGTPHEKKIMSLKEDEYLKKFSSFHVKQKI